MKKKIIIGAIIAASLAAVVLLTMGGVWIYQRNAHYDFDHTVPPAQAIQRTQVVKQAQQWLGAKEGDSRHKQIVDLYNAHTPLAQGYQVTYDDNWCATFVSTVAIQLGITDIIPTECGCQRQIELFQQKGCWEENDDYLPLPGDIIYYCMENAPLFGDCTGWSDHVGIVVGTAGEFIKVIEGNYGDEVAYRYLSAGDRHIRGYAIPAYGSSD
ncbi:MAG: CHAP domain-containing protein [Oscillospiraceae bacterium]|nr:CHAP domain-containing protein [Oscillospiraceae bacterium]